MGTENCSNKRNKEKESMSKIEYKLSGRPRENPRLTALCPIRLHCRTNYNAPTGAYEIVQQKS